MNRFLHPAQSRGFSRGEARQVVIVVLLVISALAAVWTYWPQIERLIGGGAKRQAPGPGAMTSSPVAPPAPKLRTATPQIDLQQGEPSVKAVGEKKASFNLVEEAELAEEPEGALPEKLNTIKILEGDEIKRIERQLVARRKMDDASVIREYLRGTQIGGVRVSGTMSKLLLDGQVYLVGDTVRESPRVTIQKITKAEVIFVDEKGNQYPLNY
jgi:hypothetical protein